MSICKDCINQNCPYLLGEAELTDGNEHYFRGYDELMNITDIEKICPIFKDRNRFIELPCAMGDEVYRIELDKTISKWYVFGFTKYDGQVWAAKAKNDKNKWRYIDICIIFSDFGKTAFLSSKEAKAKLREGDKNEM